MISELAMQFVMEFNTTKNRKKLASKLFNVKRIHQHMLPAHARFIAIIGRYLKDVPEMVLKDVKAEKDQLL